MALAALRHVTVAESAGTQWQAPLSYYALQMHPGPQPQTQAESGPLRELEAA